MRSRLTSALAVIGALALLLVAANGAAYAATGHALLLGHRNSTTAMTTVNRTRTGPALRLHTQRSSNAPLSVNGRGRVANLDADLLDGYDSAQLLNRTYVFTTNVTSDATGSYSAEIPVPTGTYQFAYSAYMSEGSGYGDCYLRQNNPSGTIYVGEQLQPPSTGFRDGMSGAGQVTKAAGGHVYITCQSSVPWTTGPNQPLQVTMIPTLVVPSGSLARTAAPRPGPR